MTIHAVKHSDTKLELKPEGRIDSSNAADVQRTILAAAEQYRELVINMAALDYISSAGLRSLLTLQKTMARKSGRMTLSHVSDSIREVFELTGFVNLLNIM